MVIVSDTSIITNLYQVGQLLEAKLEGMIEAVKPIMDALIYNADFRIAPNLYKNVLKKAKE